MKTQAFKYRVVGAVFIVSVAVVVIPALLERTPSMPAQMTEIVSHPLVFSNAPTPLEPSEYAFSDLVDTLKAEEIAATQATQIADEKADEKKEAVAPKVQVKTETAQPQTKAAVAASKAVIKPPIPAAPPVVAQSLPPGHTPVASIPSPLAKTPAPSVITSAPKSAGAAAWAIQMGAFTSEANADALVKQLQAAGYSAYIYSRNTSDLLRVLVGTEQNKVKAQQRLAELNTKLQMKGVVIQL